MDDTFALELVITAGLIVFFAIVRATLSVEKPNTAQQIAEMIHEFSRGQCEQVIGHGYERFQSFVTCVGIFHSAEQPGRAVLPHAGDANQPAVVPLGVAVLTFLYYNFHGVREQGPIGYMKHIAGPVWWMSPLLFPVEVISHLARVMSLTIRLYANMLASDLLTVIFFSMVPLGGSGGVPGLALPGVDHSGLCVHAAGDDLYRHGGFARALENS